MPKKKESALRDRVEAYIKQKGVSVRSFESSIGVPNGTISQFSDNTSRETLCKIGEKFPDFDVDYMLTGRAHVDTNTYTTDNTLPYQFIERLFEERKTHDLQVSALIEENRKSGERFDALVAILNEQIILLKKMSARLDGNAICVAVGGAE